MFLPRFPSNCLLFFLYASRLLIPCVHIQRAMLELLEIPKVGIEHSALAGLTGRTPHMSAQFRFDGLFCKAFCSAEPTIPVKLEINRQNMLQRTRNDFNSSMFGGMCKWPIVSFCMQISPYSQVKRWEQICHVFGETPQVFRYKVKWLLHIIAEKIAALLSALSSSRHCENIEKCLKKVKQMGIWLRIKLHEFYNEPSWTYSVVKQYLYRLKRQWCGVHDILPCFTPGVSACQ